MALKGLITCLQMDYELYITQGVLLTSIPEASFNSYQRRSYENNI